MSLHAAERRLGWGLLAPALLWTGAFFVMPFLAMLALSFAHMEGRAIVQGFDPDNYIRAFTDWSQVKALINSVEITLTVTVISVVLAWPLAAIIAWRVPPQFQRLALFQAHVGTTFVHVTHDQEEAMAIADRIVVMSAGKIADIGPPREVYLRPKSLFSAAFMGEINQIAVTHDQTALGPLVPGTGTLLIRPESIGLAGTFDLGSCKVEDAAFFGTHVRAHVSPLSAPNLRLTVHLPQSAATGPGEVLTLFATDHVLLEA